MIREIINEPLKKAGMEEKEAEERIEYLLNKVGMSKADMDKFPYEFSGGQRQRIGIARALSVNPEFIVCDEPIAALDVSIQAQVVNMLEDLQNEFGLTYLLQHMIFQWYATSVPESELCILEHWLRWQRAMNFIPIRCIRTQRHCFPQFRSWIR